MADVMKTQCENMRGELYDFLKKVLSIDSYTYNYDNVVKVNAILAKELKELGFEVETPVGDHSLTTVVAHNSDNAEIMLIGHTDVAHEILGNESLEVREDGMINFPGSGDMKGGCALMIFALKALKALNKLPKNIRVVISPDEERASLVGQKYLVEEAKKSKVVLSFEPARANGAIVNSRKGGTYYELEVFGKAAHSGVEPEKGINAIEDVAQKIIKLHALNDFAAGILINVGYISAGTELANSIADYGKMKISVKYKTRKQQDEILPIVEKICNTPDVSGITLKLTKMEAYFDPSEETKETTEVINLIKEQAKKLGFDLMDVHTGGEGDIGFTSTAGIPCVCGMGPIGGSLHSPMEFMDFKSMPERVALAALSILALNEKLNG